MEQVRQIHLTSAAKSQAAITAYMKARRPAIRSAYMRLLWQNLATKFHRTKFLIVACIAGGSISYQYAPTVDQYLKTHFGSSNLESSMASPPAIAPSLKLSYTTTLPSF